MHSFLPQTRMRTTGIGYGGIDGAWWLPATTPFLLPSYLRDDLQAIAAAIFLFYDMIAELYDVPEDTPGATSLHTLLQTNVPAHISRLTTSGCVDGVRPDFQLVPVVQCDGSVRYQLVATELEICPSAHGFAHAMQVGYGVEPDLVHAYADYLDGRELLFVGSAQWSEFLIEQLAFCRALEEVGARASVLYDLPRQTFVQEVEAGQRWQPPIFGVPTKTVDWRTDLAHRLHEQDLWRFWRADEEWATALTDMVGDAVLFRFGYFDCFKQEHLQQLVRWQQTGATLLNPTNFIFDSKVLLAALQLPHLRQRIALRDAAALTILDRVIPTTYVLDALDVNGYGKVSPSTLLAEKDKWVVKFAGYDRGQQAWGGRSVQIGAEQSDASWQTIVDAYQRADCPVVAQQFTPSARVDLAYSDGLGGEAWLRQGYSRLRVFFLRNHTAIDKSHWIAGTHLTVSDTAMQVSEAISSVQVPVILESEVLP